MYVCVFSVPSLKKGQKVEIILFFLAFISLIIFFLHDAVSCIIQPVVFLASIEYSRENLSRGGGEGVCGAIYAVIMYSFYNLEVWRTGSFLVIKQNPKENKIIVNLHINFTLFCRL